MQKLKNKISQFRNKTCIKSSNIRSTVREHFQAIRNKPRSKRRSFLLGITTVVSIFGLSVLAPKLASVAKDIPASSSPKPGGLTPSPSKSPSEEIIKGLSGAAAAVCSLAITSGSFVIGIGCGVVVVIGILKVQGR